MNWQGLQSSDWFDEINWTPDEVPGALDTAIVAHTHLASSVEVSSSALIFLLEIDNDPGGAPWGITITDGGELYVDQNATLFDHASLIIEAGGEFFSGFLTIGATSDVSNFGTLTIGYGAVFNGVLENYGIFNAVGEITGNVAQDDYLVGAAPEFRVAGMGTAGDLSITGNLTLSEGLVRFDFQSSAAYDSIDVTGNLDFTLDDIRIDVISGYKFDAGWTFTLIDVAGGLDFSTAYDVTIAGQHANFAYFVGTLAGSNDIVFQTFNSGTTGGAALLDASSGGTSLQYLFDSYDGIDSVYGGIYGAYWQRIVNITEIKGTSHNDIVSAFDSGPLIAIARNMTIDGRGGNDSLTGGYGDDTLTGGSGNDEIDGGNAVDTVTFQHALSNYTISFDSGVYTITDRSSLSSDGTDTVTNVEEFIFNGISYTADEIYSATPSITVTQALAVREGAANVSLAGKFGAVDTDSSSFTWTLLNNAGNRFTLTSSGELRVAKGVLLDYEQAKSHVIQIRLSDGISSRTQNFTVNVQDVAKENLAGTSGADKLYGGVNVDKFAGAGGNDTVRGGGGKDVLDGGTGYDAADYADKTKAVFVNLSGATPANVLVNGTLEDSIKNFENVIGGSAGDRLIGDSKSNVFTGNGGADTLDGGTGNDTLIGGAGKDSLTGGSGADKFVFNTALSATANVDTIRDFTHDVDLIQLDDAIFKTIGTKLLGGQFYAKAGAIKAHDADDRIIYDKATGKLYFDDDGNKAGGHAAIWFATLSSKPQSLDAGDFGIV